MYYTPSGRLVPVSYTHLDVYKRQEQAALRAEYVAAMKASLKRQLDSTVVVQPDGTRKKLKQKGAQ